MPAQYPYNRDISLRASMRSAIGRVVGASAGFLLVLAIGLLVVPRTMSVTTERPPRSMFVDPVASLRAGHDCWSGQAPADVGVPGHAIVTLPGQSPRLVRSKVGFAIWLEGRPGRLHAFCR